MMRTFLAIAAGLLCAAAGFRRGKELQCGGARLSRWVTLLRHLALLMREGAGSLPEVMLTAACEDMLPDRILRALAEGLRTHPLSSPEALLDPSALPPQEQDILLRLASRLGRGSRESRVQAIEGCAEEMALLGASIRQKADTEAAMWRQLGIIGGLCLTLWLI